MLKFVPDDKLKEELSNPNGPAPQYLILSEVVRRDKMREGSTERPTTTVVQDILGGGQPQTPQSFASGGFISASESMGNAGFHGYPTQPPKMHNPISAATGIASMFAPNANPAPPPPEPPQTNTNTNVTIAQGGRQQSFDISKPQPKPDDGQTNDFNSPSYYEQGSYANGGLASFAAGGQAGDLPFFIKREADRLGIDPIDLATAISYETKGTFNPAEKGPTTKWGRHIGLIQMGEPQRKEYGYDPEGSLDSQMSAVGRYLKDRGVKPGMGLLDVYSTINAGAPGLYNLSDEKAGGAPGTVYEKVRDQMAGHKEKAMNLFGMLPQEFTNLVYGRPYGAGQGAAGFEARAEGLPSPDMATRRGGIMELVGLKPGTSGADQRRADLRTAGMNMMQQQLPQAPAVEMASGDVRGLARIYSDPAEMAKAMADYSQYIGTMASGGAVRMADAGMVPGPKVHYNVITGTYTDETGRVLSPEEALKVRPNQITSQPLTSAGTFDAGTSPDTKTDSSSFSPTAYGWQDISSNIPKPNDVQPTTNQVTGSLFSDDFRSTPTQIEVARRAGEKFRAERDKLTPFEQLMEFYKQQAKDMQAEYARQRAEEERRMKESGGMGAFLRRMGIGMLTDSSSLGRSLQAGAAAATSGGEESRQKSLDAIRELDLKERMVGLTNNEAMAKLAYQAAVSGAEAAREGRVTPRDYFNKAMELKGDYIKAVAEGADAATLADIKAEIDRYMALSGTDGTIGGGAATVRYDLNARGLVPK
jgi:hypothetical protein